jgi:regulator of replication initiation timing
MNFKASMNKKIIFSGLQAENIENAVQNMETLINNFIKVQETVIEENVAILFLENSSRIIISQDKAQKNQKDTDTDELIALIQMDQEKGRIVCSTIKASSRRAAKAPEVVRKQFSELGGKFKDKTITGKAGWQFMPEKEGQVRYLLVNAGITIEEVS